MRRRALLGRMLALILPAAALNPAPAFAQKLADTLRVAWRDAIPDLDPYYNQLRVGFVLGHQAWDTLIYRDPNTFQLKPLLATGWRNIDPTTIEFDLRHGVTFQDGSPFSADDVVYTVNSVISDPNVQVPSNYEWIAGAEKIANDKVRLKLRRVFPAALEYLAMTLPIWPEAYRERVGAAAYSRAPIGAGPYRIVKADGMHEIVLERYGLYYPDSPKGRPAIGRIDIKIVDGVEAEVGALLGGDVDWIWNFPNDYIEKINAVPTLQAVSQESMRIGYLSLDAAGRTGADNPLTKLKVRQAIFNAIDRGTIARTLAGAGSRVLDVPCFPTQFGCDQAAAVRYPYDPNKARQLLADAGYADGFDTEIVSYVLPAYGVAVQHYLAAVGIRAKLTQLPVAEAVARSVAGRNPLDLGSWGSYSINDVSAILPHFFGASTENYTGDATLLQIIQQGETTTDVDLRRHAYTEAIHRITANAYWLPINTYLTFYGFSRMLNFPTHSDELPRFFLASWR